MQGYFGHFSWMGAKLIGRRAEFAFFITCLKIFVNPIGWASWANPVISHHQPVIQEHCSSPIK